MFEYRCKKVLELKNTGIGLEKKIYIYNHDVQLKKLNST